MLIYVTVFGLNYPALPGLIWTLDRSSPNLSQPGCRSVQQLPSLKSFAIEMVPIVTAHVNMAEIF